MSITVPAERIETKSTSVCSRLPKGQDCWLPSRQSADERQASVSALMLVRKLSVTLIQASF
jgi:hypothetical protein